MTKVWTFLDINNLAWRAMFGHGQGRESGVVYGILRDLETFQAKFGSYTTVCCFDHGKGKRETAHSFYKETRRKKKFTDDQEFEFREFKDQITRLRCDILPKIGYSNILYQDGYEADDIIASAVNALPDGDKDEAVIISGDKDLLQLLSDSVKVYHPITDKLVTRTSFRKEWGLGPGAWNKIKAVAGCKTDDIPGVEGVGELTAAKFFRRERLKQGLATKIDAFMKTDEYRRNLQLVSLPYEGCRTFNLYPDNLDLHALRRIKSELGIRSF